MANDLVVRLLLKSGAFSNDIKVAKGQIQNFQNGCRTAGQSVDGFSKALGINVGSLTKLGSVVGIAAAAGKEFKAVMDSSQTTADGMQVAIAGAKGALDAFNTSLATADFTAFRNGLRGVIEDAKEAARTLDQLGNTQIAFDFLSKENTTKFQEGYAAIKDPTATKEMKEAAKKQMKEAIDAQYEYAENYNNIAYQNYVAQVVKKAGSANIKAFRVTRDQFRQAMLIDISENPQAGRDANERQYQEYKKQLKEFGKNNLTAQEELKKRYSDVIAIHAMLELMKDDELKGLGELLGGMEMAKQSAIQMEKSYNRAVGKEGSSSTKVVANIKKEEEALDGSLAKWKEIAREAEKHRDQQVFNSEDWNKYNTTLTDAKNKIVEIENEIAKLNRKPIEPLAKIDSSKILSGAKAVVQNQTGLAMKNTSSAKQASLGIDMSGIQTAQTFTSSLQSSASAVTMLSESLRNLREMEDENITGFDMFVNSLSMGVNMLNTLSTVMQTVNTITELFGATSKTVAAEKVASDATIIASTQATAGTQVAANTAVAGSGAAAAMASIPWVGPALAAAAVAGIIALLATTLPKFATGGIVGGTSFTGDRVLAGVNSGEMILNKSQQSNLWRQINSNVGGNNQVEFHISGTELVGVLNNNNRKSRLVR